MKPISVKDRLPENNQYVLVHVPNKPWSDTDDEIGVFWVVAKFIRGISQEEREALHVDDPRRVRYYRGDQWDNNLVPYCWDEFGPDRHFGQEVTEWCELPR